MGALKEEFIKQWDDVYRTVKSMVLTQTRQGRNVNIDALNKAVERETSAWNNEFESKGRFIEKVRAQDNDAADELLRQITRFRLEPIVPPQISHVAAAAVGTAVGAGTFAALQWLVGAALWLSASGGVVGLAAATALMNGNTKTKYIAALRDACGDYLTQVNAKRDELAGFLEKLN